MTSPKFSIKRSLSESSAEEFINKQPLGISNKNDNSKTKWRNEPFANHNGQNEKNQSFSNTVDILIRVILVIVFFLLEGTPPFLRKIHPEEMWLYKNPRTVDYVSPRVLFLSVVFGPLLGTVLYFLKTGDRADFSSASWTWTLILGLNGLATSLLKITVGRPRPDFFYRCFPDGVLVVNNPTGFDDGTFEFLNCTGNEWDISEGRKSFPSGHSSFAFASYGFLTYYAAGKLHAFNSRGRGQTWRLCISIIPLVLASLIAVSRTCDYHHHWQDVLVGSLIGLFTSYMVYRQYYPSIFWCSESSDMSSNCCSHTRSLASNLRKTAMCYDNTEHGLFDDDLLNADDHRPLLSIRAGAGVTPSRRCLKM